MSNIPHYWVRICPLSHGAHTSIVLSSVSFIQNKKVYHSSYIQLFSLRHSICYTGSPFLYRGENAPVSLNSFILRCVNILYYMICVALHFLISSKKCDEGTGRFRQVKKKKTKTKSAKQEYSIYRRLPISTLSPGK